MNRQTNKPTKEKSIFRQQVIIPFLIFGGGIIPLFIGLFLYYNPHYLSGATTQRGELISPPLDMRPWLGEPRKWQIMLLTTEECQEQCEQMLYYGQQTHKALKTEYQVRVERILFMPDSVELSPEQLQVLARQNPPIAIYKLTEEEMRQLFGGRSSSPALNNNVFLVDPNGNLILRHDPITSISTAKDLLKDLKHLLRSSRIG